MKKIQSIHPTYTLLLLNADEEVLTGFTTKRDIDDTRRLAASALRLNGRAAYVDIHNYAPHAAELEGCEPIARVTLDDSEVSA